VHRTREVRGKTIRDVMKPDVVTVVPEMTVRELVETFVEEHVRGAPVLGPTGKVIGMVSETDVLRLMLREPAAGETADARLVHDGDAAVRSSRLESDLDRTRVGEIMGPVSCVLAPDDTLAHVAEAFASDGVQRVVVIENGILLGIVTPADLMPTLAPPASAP
jgi:CBS domain-containing protein